MLINIGGQERPIKFGTNATAKFCELENLDLTGYGLALFQLSKGTLSGTTLRSLVYAGLYAACKSEKLDVDFDVYDVGDWLDTVDEGEAKKVFEALMLSLPKNEKKKVVKKNV